MFKKIKILFAVLTFISSATANADLAIIVHLDYQGGDLNEEMVKELLLN